MQVLTSLILAAFAAYAGAWYLGKFEGNFALLLFMATVVTGVYWVASDFFSCRVVSVRRLNWKPTRHAGWSSWARWVSPRWTVT